MRVHEQIKNFIATLPEPKRSEIKELHQLMLQLMPKTKLWFDDGKNSENKTTNNPSIGYGLRTIKYANGKIREFFQIGISPNQTGISVYILGIKDKTYLAKNFGKNLGKAALTGYCIRFKTIKDIHLETLKAAVQFGLSDSLQE